MRERKKYNKPFTQKQCLEIFLQIIFGLYVLNYGDKKIIHRDIKPDNIMIGQAIFKVGDFGSSKITLDNKFQTSYVGTRRYNAPEFYD